MKLSILDFGIIPANSNSISIIHQTIEYAKTAEELGFHRFWLGEHHEKYAAWRTPSVLLPIIAGYTETIKIGVAGVLLSLNNPLRVAQDYKLIENLFPNRIDLGLAKGVTEEIIMKELLEEANLNDRIDNFYLRANKLIKFLKDDSDIKTPPFNGNVPKLWVLGSGKGSLDFSIKEKIAFSLSLFHSKVQNQIPSPDIIRHFIENYENLNKQKPTFNIAITAICNNKKSDIEKYSKGLFADAFMINFAGDQYAFRDKIQELKELYQTEEIVILDAHPDIENKIQSLNLMAEIIIK